MRKACIQLMGTTQVACLAAGALGTGRCLYMVIISQDMAVKPTTEQWANALRICESKAAELKYEVVRVQGRKLVGKPI